MATHAGSEGIVRIGENQVGEVKSWSLEEVSDTVDASIIGTQWRKNMATIRSWSGSIDAFWDETDDLGQGILKIGSTVDLRLFPSGAGDGRHYFAGSAIITGLSRQGSFDGIVESSFTFQGNAALSEEIYQVQVQQEAAPAEAVLAAEEGGGENAPEAAQDGAGGVEANAEAGEDH